MKKIIVSVITIFFIQANISAKTYEVGPGHQYKNVEDVNWLKLDAGDTVNIHWREEPYRGKIGLRCRGKKDRPVRIVGIKGPNGELPVLSGENAITGKYMKGFFSPKWDESLGVIVIKRGQGDRWGYKPGFIEIENLKITGAHRSNTYTSMSGDTVKYSKGAAAVWAVLVENFTVRGLEITDNANGLFVLSKNSEEEISKNILFESNYLHNNGNVGEYGEHNIYTQALGVVFQYNRIDRLRKGAVGSSVKDRSGGLVIRYNRIESSARTIDLVEAEDSYRILKENPEYFKSWVYGNILINDVDKASGYAFATRMIHYGGDTGLEENYRKGVLYFFYNTVVINANQNDVHQIKLFEASTNEEKIDLRNNIIYLNGTTNLALMNYKGIANFEGTNWISENWQEGRTGFEGVVNINGELIVGTDPGLTDDYQLLKNSPSIDRAGDLPLEIFGRHDIAHIYTSNLSGVPRRIVGKKPDLGAFEFVGR